MLRNYFKVAIRYLIRHKLYAVINILGLAVGIGCCVLIMLFVKSELSFDRLHSKSDRLFRVWIDEIYEDSRFTNTVTPIPMGPYLHRNFPEIQAFCRVNPVSSLVKYGNNSFGERITLVDSNFFELFDFEMSAGNIKNPFPTSNSILVSEPMAKKYFGDASPIGQNVELQLSENKVLFTVSGVTKPVKEESSVQFNFLIPFSNARYLWGERARTVAFSNVQGETYVLLKSKSQAKAIAGKMEHVISKTLTDYKPGEYNIYLQPITDIHLNNKLPQGNEPISNPAYSYILATIGLLILLIASINFVTLSVGASATRSLEVGVRKVLGAQRMQLLRQFWGEAVLITLLSLLIGIGLSLLFLGSFNTIVGRELVIEPTLFFILFALSLVFIVGFVAGIYPAIILSGFAPIEIMKRKFKSGTNIGLLRKGLIVGQFIASIIMIIGTVIVGQQLNYVRSKNLGYSKEQVVIVPTSKRREQGLQLAKLFREEIGKSPRVVKSSASIFSFAEPGWFNLGYIDDKGTFRQFRMNGVDHDFIGTLGLQLIQGRDFSLQNPSDNLNSMIVNEALVKEYGWKDPIGQKLPGKYNHRIIGVVRDFHFESLHTKIQPLALVLRADTVVRLSSDVTYNSSPQPRISVRLAKGSMEEHLAYLKQAWKKVARDQEFTYRFLDETLESQYRAEQRLGTIVKAASVLSIFIACIGLFGVTTLVVARRTKEIGIRKVLGADVKQIVALLSRDFVLMVLIAAMIASPVAWWALTNWLQDFAYRINIEWWVFAVASIAALIIALATVSIQAVRAALANPVNSLRTE